MHVPFPPALHRLLRLAAFAALAAGLVAVALPASPNAGAAPAAKPKFVVLGDTGRMPAPRCPEKCLALATVTALPAKVNGITAPYRVPFDGKITSWKLGLGKPNRSQRQFFTSSFGNRPSAGLAVLKQVKVKGKVRYLLRKRTPIEGLNRALGTVASWKLAKPVKVNKGNFIALTVPTWAPLMAMPDGITAADNNWRASRNRGTCRKMITPKTSRPQQKLGSKREYGCRFNGEQLLYRVKVARR